MSYRARQSQRFVIAMCLGLVVSVAAVGWLVAPTFQSSSITVEGRDGTDAADQTRRGAGATATGPQFSRGEGDGQGGRAGDGSGSGDGSEDGSQARGPRDGSEHGDDDQVRGANHGSSGSSSGSGTSRRTDGGSGSSRSHSSSGRTWRENDPFGLDLSVGDEDYEEPQDEPLPEYWLARVENLQGEPVSIAIGLFAPQPPHELRETGLYGDGRNLLTRYADSDGSGRLAVPMHEILDIIGADASAQTTADLGGVNEFARLNIGVFVNDARFEPLVMTMSVSQVPTSPPRILLTDANYVEIRVREEVSNRPLGDAEVELWRFDPAQPQVPLDSITLRTDSEGIIVSRIMPGRSYAFRVSKDGYATSRTERFVAEERDVYYQIPLFRGNFISGYVVNSSRSPIRGATVTCIQPGEGYVADETDGYGHFYVGGIPHGVWSSEAFVTVEADGYATLVEQVLVNSENVELVVTTDAGLTGIVHPSEGMPRVATKVRATQSLYGDEEFEHEFDVEDDGTFAIGGMIPGQVTLVAISAAGERSDPVTINYTPSEPQQVELHLNPPARLFVNVNRQDGQPVEGLRLRVGDWDGQTDAAGTVLWDVLLPGPAELRVVPDDPEGNRATAGELVYFVPDPVEVALTSGDTAEVTLTLSVWLPPTEITPLEVRFVGDPIVGASGTARLIAAFGGGQDTATHTVSFEGGLATIFVELRTDPQVEATHELRFEHNDYRPVTRSQEELAAAVQAEQPLVIQLVRAPSLSLQIVDRNGAHVEQAAVQLRRGGSVRASGETDGVGRLLLTHLEEGTYRLIAVKHAYRRAVFDIELPIDSGFTPQERDDGTRIELLDTGYGTSDNPTRLKLTMSNAGDVTIRVQSTHGGPAVGAQVLVKRRHDQNAPLVIFDVGKTDGQGERIVRLHWDAQYQVVVYNENGIAYTHFYNDPNEPIYTFELDMEQRGTISGVVENPNGSPAGNVEVMLVATSGAAAGSDNHFSIRTNSNGQWSIPVPAVGTYTATCPDEGGTTPVTGLPSGATNVTLVRGQ